MPQSNLYMAMISHLHLFSWDDVFKLLRTIDITTGFDPNSLISSHKMHSAVALTDSFIILINTSLSLS